MFAARAPRGCVAARRGRAPGDHVKARARRCAGGEPDIQRIAPKEPGFDPHGWSGRAVQEVSDDWRMRSCAKARAISDCWAATKATGFIPMTLKCASAG